MDRLFCDRGRKQRTRVCFPNASVREVGNRLGSVMNGEGVAVLVCFSVSGNDTSRATRKELRRRFREALGPIRDSLCGRNTMYVRDGVHFSRRRGRALSHSLECRITEVFSCRESVRT